jgi:hypothetical protein
MVLSSKTLVSSSQGGITVVLSRKHLDYTVAACTDDISAVLTPHHATNTFAPHGSVRRDVLRALSLLKRPESDRCIVSSRDRLSTVLGQGQ